MGLARCHPRCRLAPIIVALVWAIVPTPHAIARSYEVSLCSRPTGPPLGTDGWDTFIEGSAGRSWSDCGREYSAGRALVSELAANTRLAREAYAGWTFTAPPNTTIGSYTLWRAVRPASGIWTSGVEWAHAYWLFQDARVPFDPRYGVEACVPWRGGGCSQPGDPAHPFSEANRVTRAGVDIKRLFALMDCTGSEQGCPPTAAPGRLQIFGAKIGITDLRPPSFTRAPTGSLLGGDQPLEGEHAIRFTARDEGGGISRVGIVVDGSSVASRPLEPTNTRCVPPYAVRVPCPLAGEATIALDTAQIPNGTHSVQASVTDAAGNETRSAPVTVTTRNGSRPNGRGASRFVTLSAGVRSSRGGPRASAVVPFGAVRTAEGRLTDAGGSPIAGAQIEVLSRVARPGAAEVPAGTAMTSDTGRFAFKLARGPSRTVRFAYRAYTLDPAPVSSATVTLGVRAGLTLSRRPARLRNGQRVVFRGRLRGGPGRTGTRVTIDVLVPDARRRVPIANVRGDSKGRFHFAYRFRRTLVKARYRFQARLVAQPGYPYRGATSRRVAVLVRP